MLVAQTPLQACTFCAQVGPLVSSSAGLQVQEGLAMARAPVLSTYQEK